MKHRSRFSLITVTAGCLVSCATVPPPSKFVGARWAGQQGFAETPVYIRNGKFVAAPPEVSEVIDLGGLYAVSPKGEPIPTIGAAADFDLYRQQPGKSDRPSARVRGGKLVQ